MCEDLTLGLYSPSWCCGNEFMDHGGSLDPLQVHTLLNKNRNEDIQ